MPLLSSKNLKRNINSYTYREIVENEYPEIWNLANDSVHKLESWQKMLVKKFPSCYELVIENNENRELMDAQIHLMNYLKLRSIYGFAHEIYRQINRRCHELAVCSNECDHDGEDKAKRALNKIFERLNYISIEGIVKDEVSGFFRLYQVIEFYDERFDFHVIDRYFSKGRHATASYHDITGSVMSKGLRNYGLWKMASQGLVPTKPNITGLMESEEDNEMVRVY